MPILARLNTSPFKRLNYMTQLDEGYIRIPAPKFELHQFVTLHWNGCEYNTRIVERLFNLDDQCWLYQVGGSEKYYSSDVLEAEIARPLGNPKYAVGQVVGSLNRPTDYSRKVEQVLWSSESQEYIYNLENEDLWFSEDELETR